MPVVDVMMGKANQVPYDLQAQQAEEQRRALIMQQLLSSAQTPASGTIPGTGKIVLPNYAGAIGKVLESLVGVAGQQNVAEQQARIAGERDKTATEEARRYTMLAQGGQPMGAGPGEETVMSKPNLNEAIKEGVGMKTQAVREMAMAAQKEKDKLDLAGQIRDMDRAKLAEKFLPSSVGPGTDPSQFRPMPQVNVVDGIINQTIPGEAQPPVPPRAGVQYGPTSQATPTSPAMAVNTLTNEPKAVGQGSLRQEPVNAAALELGKQSIDSLVKRVSESYGKLVPAVNNAGYLVDALDVLDKAYVGKPWSSLELPARKALLALGVGPDPQGKIPATEMITPLLGTAAFDMLKALRPASDRDVITVKEMLAIAPANDPETTKQVVKISIAALLNDYAMHGKSLSAMDEFGKMKEFEGLVPGIKKQYELPTLFLPPIPGIETPEGAPAHATMPQQRTGTPKRIKFSDLP